MKIDMHVHTRFSKDSTSSLEDIVETARARGLDGLAITDHDTVEGVKQMKSLDHGLHIIPGIEKTTDRGEILGLFIEKEIESEEADKVIREIKTCGGIAVIPHPFDPFRGFKDWKGLDIDGIEVFNSRNLLGSMNRKAASYAQDRGLIRTAGSDSHTTWELGKAYVEADAEDLDGFRKKLEGGEVSIHGSRSSPMSYIVGNMEKIRNLVR